jgi:L-malate glycosyltransferase
VGGVSEVIEDGASGYLAPSGDPGGLADAVLALAADVRLRREFGGRGQARANARFSEELMHREYCEAYDQNA